MTLPDDDSAALATARHERLAQEVEATLDRHGLVFAKDAGVSGLNFDYVVEAPDHQSIAVIEIKSLTHDSQQLANRALHLVERARSEVGAGSAYLVTSEAIALPAGLPPNVRVVTPMQLADTLLGDFQGRTRPASSINPEVREEPGLLFAAMPFVTEYDDTYYVAIRGAADDNGLAAVRVDHDEFVGDILAHIRDRIRASTVVVADLSEARPNVLYEMGFAHGIGVPVVPITSTPEVRPFDVAHENTITCERGRTTGLRPALASRVAAAIAEA